jgi:hypothetical protein
MSIHRYRWLILASSFALVLYLTLAAPGSSLDNNPLTDYLITIPHLAVCVGFLGNYLFLVSAPMSSQKPLATKERLRQVLYAILLALAFLVLAQLVGALLFGISNWQF